MELCEREATFDVLEERLRAVSSGAGHVSWFPRRLESARRVFLKRSLIGGALPTSGGATVSRSGRRTRLRPFAVIARSSTDHTRALNTTSAGGI